MCTQGENPVPQPPPSETRRRGSGGRAIEQPSEGGAFVGRGERGFRIFACGRGDFILEESKKAVPEIGHVQRFSDGRVAKR
jgi:hypothetical protein